MYQRCIILILLFVLSGCSIGHKKFFYQTAPTTYPPTEEVLVFEYQNVDIKEIYELLYSDYLIIGKSAFNGPYESPHDAVQFAKSIGADVFISTSQFAQTKTSFVNIDTPDTTTTSFSGYGAGGSFSGTATTFGTQTTTVPITVDRYDQEGLYLHNLTGFEPLWEQNRSDYEETGSTKMTGQWEGDTYAITLIQSGKNMVGFVNEVLANDDRRDVWQPNDLKLIFNLDNGNGVYLMGDKSPVPSNFKVNKFGHLEVKVFGDAQTFSFQRKTN
ncbi:hypothetical protein [Marinobacter nauticus]|uniref:hypothetical protein n=1 Tax=Marinobacter nauticus TaxID=2743 RepID=UPI003514DECB